VTTDSQANPGEAQARRLERVHEQLAALLNQPEVARRLRAAPGENEWSAMQILGHLQEMIPYWLGCCRAMIAATTEPPRFGRGPEAPERLAGVERGATGDPDELLRLLGDEVRAAAGALRQLSPAERDKRGLHVRRGEMTVAEVLELFVVAHAEDHLAQVRTALQAG
jgi:uncharacterized damage-inducible protein DinB